MKSAGTSTPGPTEVVIGALKVFPVVDTVGVKTGWVIGDVVAATGADLLLVACRWFWLILLVVVMADAGRLLENRTFRRCLPVAAMMGIWGCSHLVNLCNGGFFVCLMMKSQKREI